MNSYVNHHNILICDDSLTNVLILSKLIETEVRNTSITSLTDPRKVLPQLEQQDFDLILLDLEMPGLNGFEVLYQIRQRWEMDQLPVIILTGSTGADLRNKSLSNGANDFMNKPFDQAEICLRVNNTLKIANAHKVLSSEKTKLESLVQDRTQELDKTVENVIQLLGMIGEYKDTETAKHVLRVGKISQVLALGAGLPADLAYLLEKAAPLHDIGKVGVPDRILLKQGPLDEEEMRIMKQHTEHGYNLLSGNDALVIQLARSIAATHHERWDGNGYLHGLSGESIPIEGRITSIADVFDALVSERPYKQAWSYKEAADYIVKESGKAFDPKLILVFQQHLDDIIHIQKELAD
ncbi:HD domain-containing phosphohydrolase [Neptuniibacter sp. QD48_55]|uniref:HD domain-containing phosphohydrolase n=1 Tax=Neptuniibacter sp. QD48_55 TaxID=3398212 RepID=UPI0039F5A04F